MRNYRQRKFASHIMRGSRRLRATDTNGLKILVSEKGEIVFYEDSCKQGELDSVDAVEFDVRGIYNSAEELVGAIQDGTRMYDNLPPSEFVFHDGTIETSELVADEHGDWPTDEQKALWRKGELNLCSAHLWLPIKVVLDGQEMKMSKEDAKAFGFYVS